MIEIEVNNRTGCPVPLKKIQALLDFASARLAARRKQRLSLAFVGVKTMHGLNRTYRKKDRPTDVLSFGHVDGFFGEDTIGEIIICPVVARAQAREFGHSFDDEIIKLVLHGYLHLLGFDHEGAKEAGRMEGLENKILTQFYG
ncbi:rRNA maturation RNase YbeY [Candidatus Falkowbacteria bacterium RIFOXYC2_FULL_48_21]|uniref:Endoribonuclease YbeY n=1 Tax=Candidatus Falkowbacteria bacterium RIFOXYC2_FULL_48_21 TaxID=1798005 RepID=A0A1F5T7G3_9BACT|nr:MAG: rRNA maturation RNase YbeY [Candidatus Falkowbacteria bacterium RIFOXYC2_FULL_48_21]